MKKWCKAILFLLPLLFLVAAVNWYVDSYAYLRVTYDEIGRQIAGGMNVEGLEESKFNDRRLLLACLERQKGPKHLVIAGSSRVMNFDHGMFQTDSFYNTALSESTIYDLLAVAGILDCNGCLPDQMIIGVDAFLFNASHNNDRWKELEDYVIYMEDKLNGKSSASAGRTGPAADSGTGRDDRKWLSLDYFRYNVTLLPEHKRFLVEYTTDWETERYLKHYDGSIAYQRELREVDVQDVIGLTEQAIADQVVYRMTDYHEIDEMSVELFAGLLDYLQDRGVEVMLYLPPYSPMMYNYIESAAEYRIVDQVEEMVAQMAANRHIALYGSYDPEGCGLEMTDLYDIYHVKTKKMKDTFYRVN